MKHVKPSVDFETINRAALQRLPDLCVRWLPNGRRRGHEYVRLIHAEPIGERALSASICTPAAGAILPSVRVVEMSCHWPPIYLV